MDFCAQFPENYSVPANAYGVVKDHAYATKSKPKILVSTPEKKPTEVPEPNLSINSIQNSSVPDIDLNASNGSIYEPDESCDLTEESNLSQPLVINKSSDDYITEKKYVISENCLDSLFQHIKVMTCPKCSEIADTYRKYVFGTMVKVNLLCINEHVCFTWSSQPTIGKLAAFNLLYTASIIFSGKIIHSFNPLRETRQNTSFIKPYTTNSLEETFAV